MITILWVIVGCITVWYLFDLYRWVTCQPRFDGKTIVVTGGSSGIGEQMAKEFVLFGASKVIIAARRLPELERVKRESKHPDRVQIWQMDLSDPKACMASVEKLGLEHVDILVNNGGIVSRPKFVDMDFDTIQQLMTTNTVS